MSNRATPRSLDENAVIRRLSLVSLIGNALLSGFKLLAGVWGHSGAMISDAILSRMCSPPLLLCARNEKILHLK